MGLTGGIEGLLKKYKVDYFKGTGEILKAGAVKVNGLDGEVQTLDTKNIVIATGSVPNPNSNPNPNPNPTIVIATGLVPASLPPPSPPSPTLALVHPRPQPHRHRLGIRLAASIATLALTPTLALPPPGTRLAAGRAGGREDHHHLDGRARPEGDPQEDDRHRRGCAAERPNPDPDPDPDRDPSLKPQARTRRKPRLGLTLTLTLTLTRTLTRTLTQASSASRWAPSGAGWARR